MVLGLYNIFLFADVIKYTKTNHGKDFKSNDNCKNDNCKKIPLLKYGFLIKWNNAENFCTSQYQF